MALLTIISVFVLICAVPQRALGQGCNCAFDPDGTLCEAACTYYSYCENFQVVTVQCQEGEVVDIEVGGCNSTANVAPPCGVWRDCSNKADGYYANEDDNCFSYHYCLNGQFMSNNLCPTDLVFDNPRQLCNWPGNVCPPCGDGSDDPFAPCN